MGKFKQQIYFRNRTQFEHIIIQTNDRRWYVIIWIKKLFCLHFEHICALYWLWYFCTFVVWTNSQSCPAHCWSDSVLDLLSLTIRATMIVVFVHHQKGLVSSAVFYVYLYICHNIMHSWCVLCHITFPLPIINQYTLLLTCVQPCLSQSVGHMTNNAILFFQYPSLTTY